KQVEKVRNSYRQRRDYMLDALARFMPPGVTWTKPEGGMFVWVTLPEGMDGAGLLAQALQKVRVAFVPGFAFHADGTGKNTIRLNFSLPNKDAIETGISRLGKLIAEEAA
ncbi:MAG: aminotransferase class I/II-fold pyridoxal phosphate-dependent enzyme, partial [Bifidobacteriales bacterium]|nr:aminotransferase class I/II-fold pyridoxal phosphate-dependent enzyme [Bifidobacteriales bacterium]